MYHRRTGKPRLLSVPEKEGKDILTDTRVIPSLRFTTRVARFRSFKIRDNAGAEGGKTPYHLPPSRRYKRILAIPFVLSLLSLLYRNSLIQAFQTSPIFKMFIKNLIASALLATVAIAAPPQVPKGITVPLQTAPVTAPMGRRDIKVR